MRRVDTPEEAHAVLVALGAPARLLTHAALVLEVADALLLQMRLLGVAVDESLVRAGAMLHDAGKILHANELSGGGAAHETAGERMLLEHGVEPRVARCCVTHAQWATNECSLEELLVALADNLWKGVRRQPLEQLVIDKVARHLNSDPWSLFVEMDDRFETVADDGPRRLALTV